MNSKFDPSAFMEHIHLLILSIIFGLASFLFKVREGEAKLTWFNGLSEMTFSLISAYMAFRLCRYMNAPNDLLWVFTGIAAWSGTRFLIKLESVLDKHINKKFDIEPSAGKEE